VAGEHDDRRLEAALAQQLDRLAPVHVRQADIHHQKGDLLVAGRMDALGRRRLLKNGEFLIEGQLLGQRFAQVVVIVDEKNGAGRHAEIPPCFRIETSSNATLNKPGSFTRLLHVV
jgi:hypothetical protein